MYIIFYLNEQSIQYHNYISYIKNGFINVNKYTSFPVHIVVYYININNILILHESSTIAYDINGKSYIGHLW